MPKLSQRARKYRDQIHTRMRAHERRTARRDEAEADPLGLLVDKIKDQLRGPDGQPLFTDEQIKGMLHGIPQRWTP